MKLVAVSLVPAFRFGGGEKWQLECLQELKCYFDEIIYISVSKKLDTTQSIYSNSFRKYNFETGNWGSEVLGSEIFEHISVCKTFLALGLNSSDYVDSDSSLLRPADMAMSVGCPEKANRQLKWNATIGFDRIIDSLIKKSPENLMGKS